MFLSHFPPNFFLTHPLRPPNFMFYFIVLLLFNFHYVILFMEPSTGKLWFYKKLSTICEPSLFSTGILIGLILFRAETANHSYRECSCALGLYFPEDTDFPDCDS